MRKSRTFGSWRLAGLRPPLLLANAGASLRRTLNGPPDLPAEAAARLRAEQIAAVVKATPLMMVGNILCAAAVVAVFRDTPYALLLLAWAAAFTLISGLAILRWLQSRGRPHRTQASPGAIKRLARRVLIPAGFLAFLPLFVFAGVDPQKKLLVSSIVSGALCVGLFGLSSVPLAALTYATALVASSIVAMAMTGDAAFIPVSLLLLVYVGCALSSVAWYSRLFVDRFLHGLELEKQSELIGILLHDFEKQASDWLWETDAEGRLQLGSTRFADVLGRPKEQLREHRLADLIGLADGDERGDKPAIRAAFGAREAFGGLATVFEAKGEERWLSITGKPVVDAAGRFKGYRGVASDITEAKRSEGSIRHMALHDALTGLPNRSAFTDWLDRALAGLSGRHRAFTVMLIDLDNFKSVNDTLGHGAGDRLLIEVARLLPPVLGKRARIARLGGDEFAVIVDGQPDAASIEGLAARIIATLSRALDLDGPVVSVGCSIGIAAAPRDGSDAETLLRRADLALYRAKADGRGCARFFDATIEAAAHKRRVIEQSLRSAIARRELDVFYQPIVDLEDGGFTGAEALLRWRHPEHGMVSPAEFIPIAEETGLIAQIGRWVLDQACRDAARWPAHMLLSVNLSPRQFQDPALCQAVRQALADSGLPPSRLELEITESALINEASARAVVDQIKALGVKLALDDFGTGYASLSYLRHLPFDKIKIDRSFVREAASSPQSRAIIESIVELGRKLSMTTTAEGIETPLEKLAAISSGCKFGQGYAFGKPQPISEFNRIFETPHSSERRVA